MCDTRNLSEHRSGFSENNSEYLEIARNMSGFSEHDLQRYSEVLYVIETKILMREVILDPWGYPGGLS